MRITKPSIRRRRQTIIHIAQLKAGGQVCLSKEDTDYQLTVPL